MKRLLPLVALAVLLGTLSGCGQKGPLYQPDDKAASKKHDKDVYQF